MEVNAQKIKQLRTEKSWTQQHLADACGISMRTVQRVERYGNASKETLMGLASVFEISQAELMQAEVKIEVVKQTIVINNQRERLLILKAGLIGLTLGVVTTITFLKFF